MTSDFRETIVFLNKLGLYDVILPFLLVFTVSFALLEKTRVLGVEKIEGVSGEHSKKHLNALASFVISFFVIASSRLVDVITEISANVVILLMAGFFFLLLAGSITLSNDNQRPYFLEKGPVKNIGLGVMFVGLVFIFLNAIKSGGETWMEIVIRWISGFSTDVSVSGIVLVLIVAGVIFYLTKDSPSTSQPTQNQAPNNGGNGLTKMTFLNDLVEKMEMWGVADVVLPFLLVYVAVFVALSKTHMFAFFNPGDNNTYNKHNHKNKKFSSIIALVVAAMVIIPHVTGDYPEGKNVVEIINQFIPQVALFLVGGIGILLVAGFFFPQFTFHNFNFGLIIGLIGVVVIMAIFASSANLFVSSRYIFFS